MALLQYLKDFVENLDDVEIPRDLKGQSHLINELTEAIIQEMSYEEAYERFVESNRT